MFCLEPLPVGYQDVFMAPKKVERIQSTFFLPPLDEQSPGAERLLGSLANTSKYGLEDKNGPGQDGMLIESQGAGLGDQEVQVESGDTLWQKLAEEPMAGPSPLSRPLYFWDRVSNQVDSTQQSPFLSEASTLTFDAVLTMLEPPIQDSHRSSLPSAIFDSKTLLDLMIRATLGTVTTEFLTWDSRASRFVWNESGGRPFGLDRIVSSSAMEHLLSIATAIRRLELVIDSQNTQRLTPTHHALTHALATYLTYIKERLAVAIDKRLQEDQPNWNKWMLASRDVLQLAEALLEVMGWALDAATAQALPTRTSSLLTHLHSHLVSTITTFPDLRHPIPIALSFLLSRTASPFLILLHSWLGLLSSEDETEDPDPESQPWLDLGVTRRYVGERFEYDFSSRKMPGFIPREERRRLFEAGKSLRLLRDASKGQHPLCTVKCEMEVSWVWGEQDGRDSVGNHVRKIKKEVDHWRRSRRSRPLSGSASARQSAVPPSTRPRKRIPTAFLDPDAKDSQPGRADDKLDQLWSLFSQPPGSHLSTNPPDQANSDSPLWAPTPLEELHDFIARHGTHPLLPASCPTLPVFFSDILLAPLLAHATLISTSLVALYLDDLHLLDHLDVLRAFWLGGDVGFMERVGGALFGKDSAGAGEAVGLGQRARTRARLGLVSDGDRHGSPAEWGIGLGIGLSERARWPPGGAELAYALRTTLLDEGIGKTAGKGESGVWRGIEDRVSFAIRELASEGDTGRRAKWLDPQAIEALDFLYLSYSPSPAISTLLSTTLMDKYQSVHNLLLRVSRVDLVLRTMYWDVIHQSETHDEPVKVGVDAGLHHLGGGRNARPRERAVHSLFPRDSKMERHLQRLRFRMTHLVSVFGRYTMESVMPKWDVMRRRLGRLQQTVPGPPPVGEADDGVLEAVLDDAQGEEDLHQLQSTRSIVLYHNLTLDKICRACLLGPGAGQQVTLKLLMTLFGLVLDLGKTLKEVERGLVGWQDGAEKVAEIGKEWDEKEAVFLHALKRLSLRTMSGKIEHGQDMDGNDQDLQMLLGDEGGADDEEYRAKMGIGGNDLQDLVLRLNLGEDVAREGRWKR